MNNGTIGCWPSVHLWRFDPHTTPPEAMMERVIERFDLMRLTEPNDILVPEQEARVSYAYQRWFAELHAALGEGEVWQGAMQRYGYAVGRRLKVVYTLAWCGRPDPTESPLWQVALAWTMAHFDANQ